MILNEFVFEVDIPILLPRAVASGNLVFLQTVSHPDTALHVRGEFAIRYYRVTGNAPYFPTGNELPGDEEVARLALQRPNLDYVTELNRSTNPATFRVLLGAVRKIADIAPDPVAHVYNITGYRYSYQEAKDLSLYIIYGIYHQLVLHEELLPYVQSMVSRNRFIQLLQGTGTIVAYNLYKTLAPLERSTSIESAARTGNLKLLQLRHRDLPLTDTEADYLLERTNSMSIIEWLWTLRNKKAPITLPRSGYSPVLLRFLIGEEYLTDAIFDYWVKQGVTELVLLSGRRPSLSAMLASERPWDPVYLRFIREEQYTLEELGTALKNTTDAELLSDILDVYL